MTSEEAWGKGWSLSPDQNTSGMEYLGDLIRSGTRYKYYQDSKGGIYFEDEPIEGKPEWMLRADKERKRRIRQGKERVR